MKKLVISSIIALLGLAPAAMTMASPQDDLKKFRSYYFKKFPGVKLQEFANGIYGIDKGSRRAEWEAMEEFPPYEPGVEIGKELFEKYNVGKCFKNGGIGIRQNYPWFDAKSGEVHTLEADIMKCLKKNGVDTKAEKIGYKKGKLAAISAYMGWTSRGKKLNVVVPNDERAMAIYNRGKHHFYAKRGQLNMSCADCHMYYAGSLARSNMLSPALGQVTHFPVYRKKWEGSPGGNPALKGFGTIQRRYGGCNKQVRAKPLKAKGKQHPEYVALEYFHTYMSNGIKVNAPGIRQ
jgi:sulfur-oxidizing protein SoxA